MGRIRLMASVLRAWWPTERGCTGLLVWLGPPGRPSHAVPGRALDALSAVVTAQWPHVWWRFGTAGTIGAEVQARQGLRGKRHGEEGQPPGKVWTHPKSWRVDGAVGRRGTVEFDGGGGLSVADTIHHEAREKGACRK
jgi:hypothetical protein